MHSSDPQTPLKRSYPALRTAVSARLGSWLSIGCVQIPASTSPFPLPRLPTRHLPVHVAYRANRNWNNTTTGNWQLPCHTTVHSSLVSRVMLMAHTRARARAHTHTHTDAHRGRHCGRMWGRQPKRCAWIPLHATQNACGWHAVDAGPSSEQTIQKIQCSMPDTQRPAQRREGRLPHRSHHVQ